MASGNDNVQNAHGRLYAYRITGVHPAQEPSRTQKQESPRRTDCTGGSFLSLRYEPGCVITPQAMRLPELPDGSVFMSSAFSWTMIDVPPFANSESAAAGSSER